MHAHTYICMYVFVCRKLTGDIISARSFQTSLDFEQILEAMYIHMYARKVMYVCIYILYIHTYINAYVHIRYILFAHCFSDFQSSADDKNKLRIITDISRIFMDGFEFWFWSGSIKYLFIYNFRFQIEEFHISSNLPTSIEILPIKYYHTTREKKKKKQFRMQQNWSLFSWNLRLPLKRLL